MPGGVELAAQHGVEAIGGERGDEAVVEGAGGVDDGGERMGGWDRGEEICEGVAIGGVAGGDRDGGAGGFEVALEGGGAGGGGALARGEDEVAHAAVSDEVAGEPGAERAGAAGEEDGAAGVEWSRDGEHELADVAGLGEAAEGVGGAAQVERGDRRRTQRAALEQGDQLGEHLVDAIGAGVDEVERLVGDARVGRRDGGGVAEVGLAHLEEVAAARQQAERGVDEVAGEAVEHDVDAAAAGGAEELGLEVERARRREMVVVEAERAQGVPLGGAGGGEYLGAEVAGELDRGDPDAAGRGVDQDALAGLETGEVDEGVVRGEEYDRDAGGVDERPGGGDAGDGAVVGDRDRSEGGAEQAEDALTRGEAGDTGTDLGHDAGALAAERARIAGVHAEGVEHVAEVEAGGADGDADLPGGERRGGGGVRDQREAVERALGGDVESPGRCGGDGERVVGCEPGEPGDEQVAVAQRELGLARGKCLGDRGGEHAARGSVVVAIDEDDRTLGRLGLGGADEPPQRRVIEVDGVTIGPGRDRAPGHEDQPARREPIVGEPGLQQGERIGGGVVRGHDEPARSGTAKPAASRSAVATRFVCRFVRAGVRGERARVRHQDEDVGNRGAVIDRVAERGEVGVARELDGAVAAGRRRIGVVPRAARATTHALCRSKPIRGGLGGRQLDPVDAEQGVGAGDDEPRVADRATTPGGWRGRRSRRPARRWHRRSRSRARRRGG